MVTFHTTVHDCGIALLRNLLFGMIEIYPIWETPLCGLQLSERHLALSPVPDRRFESLIEHTVVKEHVGVVEPSVKVSLERSHRINHAVKLLVSGQNDNRRVGSRFTGYSLGILAAGKERLVVLVAYAPVATLDNGVSRGERVIWHRTLFSEDRPP
jgi:hypothetical protein